MKVFLYYGYDLIEFTTKYKNHRGATINPICDWTCGEATEYCEQTFGITPQVINMRSTQKPTPKQPTKTTPKPSTWDDIF